MTCSMSRKGNCWDNAPTESWFNSFKNERYHGIRYETHERMKAASFDYIEGQIQLRSATPRVCDSNCFIKTSCGVLKLRHFLGR